MGRWAVIAPLIVSGWLASPLPAQRVLTQATSSRASVPSARLRIEVSLDDRTLQVLSGPDTLRTASIAVASGRELRFDDRVSVQLERNGRWFPLPEDEHLIFGTTLYIPPFGSRNREVRGELGAFALDLGDGYLVHGTPHTESIGSVVTHGCLRLFDDDIAWLYKHVPVGTSMVLR